MVADCGDDEGDRSAKLVAVGTPAISDHFCWTTKGRRARLPRRQG